MTRNPGRNERLGFLFLEYPKRLDTPALCVIIAGRPFDTFAGVGISEVM